MHPHSGHKIGIVAPGSIEKLKTKKIIKETLGLSGKESAQYIFSTPPSGMEYGTCTPFPKKSTMSSEIDAIIVIDKPSIDDKVVSISIGGCGETAHKTKAHLSYSSIYEILKQEFPDKVHIYRSE